VETLTDISELVELDRKVHQLERQYEVEGKFSGLVGSSTGMQNVFKIILKAAESNSPVIIYGESGTGKELVAHAIHMNSCRKNGPYVQVNCAALNESLIESELFGHTKGSFTGAHNHRIGRFEMAQSGDIFLDEIGDIPMSMQTKLLRVLESRQIERVGDNKPIHIDARIITATNKNLYHLIEQNQFRQDFFFRINVIPIHIPPLRDRKEDIPMIADYLLQQLKRENQKDVTGITTGAMESLIKYDWPGNVRELRSAIEYGFVIVDQGQIMPEHLPLEILNGRTRASKRADFSGSSTSPEKEDLINVLSECAGNQSKAAKILGISRVTVWNRIGKYGVDLSQFKN